MKKYLFALLIVSHVANAKPPLTAEEICLSIASDKYQSQCETAIYRRSFDKKAIVVCLKHKKDDYSKTRCMEAIRDKTYTQKELDNCVTQKEVPLNKCLYDHGSSSASPKEESATQISN